MWTLGIATAAIGAVIALLLVLYLRLSAREDAPTPVVARPPLRLRPPRLRTAPVRLPDLRTEPTGGTPECETAVMLLFPSVTATMAVATSEDDADQAVPVLEAVVTDAADQECELAAAADSPAAAVGAACLS